MMWNTLEVYKLEAQFVSNESRQTVKSKTMSTFVETEICDIPANHSPNGITVQGQLIPCYYLYY